MKQFFILLLVLSLSLSPARAAEGSAFSDVPEDAWYAPYVDVCVKAGLLNGVGDGRFDPQGIVTTAQAATIAARLHHLKSGGDGKLPQAPEDWGRVSLTFEDGETFCCYQAVRTWDQTEPAEGWYFGGRFQDLLYFERPQGWDGRDYQRLRLTWWGSDTPVSGQAEVPNNIGTSLRFIPDDWDALERLRSQVPPAAAWYRDTAYYLLTQGLDLECTDSYAYRWTLVDALDTVLDQSDLPAINQIDDYPDATDSEREAVLRFYNAGILTGTDEAGSFSPTGYLTRAEVAAMAARVLKPELRREFSPKAPAFQRYTLTPIELDMTLDPRNMEVLSSDLLLLRRQDQDGNAAGQAILRADGQVLELPEGSYLGQYPSPASGQSDPLLVLSRENMTMPSGYAYGVFDPRTGEMALPFGPYAGHGDYPGAGNCNTVEDGRRIITKEAVWDRGTWMPTLLRDDKGQFLCELPERAGIEVDWDRLNGGLAPARDPESGLWGFVDTAGSWVIPAQYPNYDSRFSQGRAVVCREDGDGNWQFGVIDSQGQEILPCAYPGLSPRGDGLYRTVSPLSEPQSPGWLREDGSTFRNGYLEHDIYLHNGYIALGRRYLDQDFQYATPAVFDWTGPINAQGTGFVGMEGKVYRIGFTQ